MEDIPAPESMPLVKLLQDGSAEVKTTHKNYATKGIEGAKAGDLVFHPTSTILKQPAEFLVLGQRTCYVEWREKSSGGGVQGYHPITVTMDPRYKKGSDRSQYDEFLGDNILKFTIFFSILIEVDGVWTPAILSLDGSNLKHGRMLTTMIRKFKYPEGIDADPASFSRKYLLSSSVSHSDESSWFELSIAAGDTLSFEDDVEMISMCLDARSEGVKALPEPISAGSPLAGALKTTDAPF